MTTKGGDSTPENCVDSLRESGKTMGAPPKTIPEPRQPVVNPDECSKQEPMVSVHRKYLEALEEEVHDLRHRLERMTLRAVTAEREQRDLRRDT